MTEEYKGRPEDIIKKVVEKCDAVYSEMICHKCKKEIIPKSSYFYDPTYKKYICWECATKGTPFEKKDYKSFQTTGKELEK